MAISAPMANSGPQPTPGAIQPPPRRAWLGLLVSLGFIAFSVAGLAVYCRRLPEPEKTPFDSRPLRQLRRARPDFVLLGNSMVQSRINERVLNRLIAPRSAMSLATGGSMTALWYTKIQNYVVPAKYRPQRLLIFFRNAELTRPRDQTTGADLANIERASPELSPVVRAKLIPPWRETSERLHYELWQVLPAERLRTVGEASFETAVERLALLIQDNPWPLRRKLINTALGEAREGNDPVDPSREELRHVARETAASLLPDILELVKDNEIPTTFVRVRTRARARGVPEPVALTRYIAWIRRYIEDHGAGFVDMSQEEWESIDLYGNGDHIGPRHTTKYTRLLVAHEPDLFR